MKIEYKIDFNSILKEVQKEKLRYWVNKEVAPEIAYASYKFIKAGNLSCNFSKLFAISSPIISGLVARNCPSFINVGPILSSESHNFSPEDLL